jgi:hypothetical protein
MSSRSTSFCMRCPECDDDIDDIEADIYIGSRTEHFWGAPCRVDESECDITSVPDCPTCKRQTVSEDAAQEHFWDCVYD